MNISHYRSVFFRVKKPIYFLHINKTGGTYVQDVVRASSCRQARLKIHMFSHNCSVLNIPNDAPFFFTVRDPFDKMCSSTFQLFRGLKRGQGVRPTYVNKILDSFRDAEFFIRSLCSPDDSQHTLARNIHLTFPHLSKSYWDFFISEEYFQAKSSRIIIALETERLSEELSRMLSDMGVVGVKNDKANLNSSERFKRFPRISSYRTIFNRDIQLYYEKEIAVNEFKFYKIALEYAKFDDRYKMVLQRFGLIK